MTYLLDRMRRGGATRVIVTTRPEKHDVIAVAGDAGAEVVLGEPVDLGASLRLAAQDLADEDIALVGFPDSVWTPFDGFRPAGRGGGGRRADRPRHLRQPDPIDRRGRDPRRRRAAGRSRDQVAGAVGARAIWAIAAARVAILREVLADGDVGEALVRRTAGPSDRRRAARTRARHRHPGDPPGGRDGPGRRPVHLSGSAISHRPGRCYHRRRAHRPPAPAPPRGVLHIARRYVPMVGGIERYVIDVAVAQARRGDVSAWSTLRRRRPRGRRRRTLDERASDGVDVTRLPGIGNQRFAVCLRPDRWRWPSAPSDVVHLHDLRFMVGFVAIVARLTGRPLVFHTHGLLAHTTFASGLKRILLRGYYGPMLRLGRAVVIASSDHDARCSSTTSRPRPADAGHAPERRRRCARYLAIDRHRSRADILVIGRVAERKGIDRLVRRSLGCAPAGPDRRRSLLIAGTEDAGERERLDALRRRARSGRRRAFHGGYTESEHATLLATAEVADLPQPCRGVRARPPRGDGRRLRSSSPATSRRIAPCSEATAPASWSTSTTPIARPTRSPRR